MRIKICLNNNNYSHLLNTKSRQLAIVYHQGILYREDVDLNRYITNI